MINTLKISFISGILMLVIILLPQTKSYGQDAAEKKDPIITISYFNLINNSVFVKVDAKYKVEKTFIPVHNLEISLFMKEAKEENLIGKVITDLKGAGRIIIPDKFKAIIDSASSINLIATAPATSALNESEGTATIENVIVEFETQQQDSTRMMRAHVFKREGKEKKPLPKVELNFFVTRTFGMLPLSADNISTDDDGMAELEFTGTIPGDSTGSIMLATKLADADTYGSVIAFQNCIWGTKTKVDPSTSALKALWASRANVPVWLMILSNSIIGAVWGTIIYLVFQLFKIRKVGRA